MDGTVTPCTVTPAIVVKPGLDRREAEGGLLFVCLCV